MESFSAGQAGKRISAFRELAVRWFWKSLWHGVGYGSMLILLGSLFNGFPTHRIPGALDYFWLWYWSNGVLEYWSIGKQLI